MRLGSDEEYAEALKDLLHRAVPAGCVQATGSVLM